MTLTIKRVADVCRESSSQEIEHPSQIFDGSAAVLVSRILGGADHSWGEVSRDYWDAFNKTGKPLDVQTAAQILVDRFPQLKGRVADLADRLCHLQPRVLSTDNVTIEFVTTVDLPVDRGTARRWGVDPLTAFLDLLEDAKGVIVENASLASKNGAPLVIATIQRGDEKWLDDLAALGFDFSGYRTQLEGGPEKHADALAGMKGSVINVPMRDILVQGTQPNETLYNFGSVVQLTALDQVGNILGVATVRPNNVDRTVFTRSGQIVNVNIAQGADTTGPKISLDRINIDTKLAVPQGKEAEVLALGADAPASYVRMDAKIGTQTITEPGAAIELELAGVTVASTAIPFSSCANIPANEEEVALRVHRYVGGETLGQMMGKAATVRAEGTNEKGIPKSDGQPVQGYVSDFALPERKTTTIAGHSLAEVPYDNTGLALTAPAGVELQDHLKSLGLDVVQRKVPGSTDQMFEVTVNPSLIQGNSNIAIDVGYRTPEGKWVWSSNEKGQSQTEPDIRTLSKKGSEKFRVLVPDTVFRQGGAETPAQMQIRMFRPDKRTPLYLGSVNFDMKEIGRTPGQLTKPEEIWTQIQSAKLGYENAVASIANEGKVVAEPITAREIERRINNGGEWQFQIQGQTYTVKKDPTGATQNAVVMLGEQVLNQGPDAVRFKTTDDLVPNEHFVVSLAGIINGYALYVGSDSIRQAGFPLPDANNEDVSPRRHRLEQLTQVDANQAPVYPDLLWRGVEIQGQRINSREDLEQLLEKLEGDRQQALRDLAAERRHCEQKK